MAVLAAAALLIGSADACEIATGVAPRGRVETAGIVVVFTTLPPVIEVGRHFTVDIRVCAEGTPPVLTRLDADMPNALGPGRVDAGRSGGITTLRADPFNLLGPWSDDRTGTAAVKTRHVEATHASFGQFKTPSLRNLAHTAPYMHDGRYATLREAVRHYSELDMERIHTHGEQLLRPLKFSPSEIDDLVAFLESLTDSVPARAPTAPAGVEGCPAS